MRLLFLLIALLFAINSSSAQRAGEQSSGTPRIVLAPSLGVGVRPAVRLDLKAALGPHFATTFFVGNNPWVKQRAGSGELRLDGAALKSSELIGGLAYGGGVLVYAKPDQTGFFGGIALTRQKYKIEATSRVPNDDPGLAVHTDNLGVILFVGLLSLTRSNSTDATATSRGSTLGTIFTAGYAHQFTSGKRIELAAELTRRNLGSTTYQIPDASPTGKRFSVSDHFSGQTVGVRVAYIVPLVKS